MRTQIKMERGDRLTIENAFDLFLRKANVRNLTENTIRTYKGHFKRFAQFIDAEELIKNVDAKIVDEFIMFLREHTNANDVTINSCLRTIRAFLYFCMECGYLKRYKITLPKAEKKIKETYTDEELVRLLKKPDLKICSFSTYKVWVFENYLLGTGNRISSALNVKISDVDFEGAVIVIRKTKNRKQQIVPLSKSLEKILKEYLLYRGGEADDYLFCNAYGEKGSRRAFQQLVQDYNISRKVTKTSCHLFRHTFSKYYILSGGDIFRLQRILGHSTLDMTKEYVQMFGNDLQEDFDRFNPLDCITRKNSRDSRIKMQGV